MAVRILATSHTDPIFVIVDGNPIRASRRSAQWCLDCVDQCWQSKETRQLYDADEIADAKWAFAHARDTYRRILEECETE